MSNKIVRWAKNTTKKKLFPDNYRKFPYHPTNETAVKNSINQLAHSYNQWNLVTNYGALHCEPLDIANYTWKTLLPYNPNNLGNWSLPKQNHLHGTRQVERQLISSLVDLLGGKPDKWEGYSTTGGTEANLFAAWTGRNYLQQTLETNKVCLIANSLTHYSIIKTADIINIDIHHTPLNRQSWSTDIPSLISTIKKLRSKYQGFLIPLTSGYTQTGTNDDIDRITKSLNTLEAELDCKFHCWVDATLNGLVLPFTPLNYYPLKNTSIRAVCLDFHKTGMTPIPTGIVLYQPKYRKFIETSIPYIHEKDNTVLGSRSGIAPAAAYSVIINLGKKGIEEIIYSGIKQKNDFIKLISKSVENIEIVNDPNTLSLGLVTNKPIDEKIRNHFSLFANKHQYLFQTGRELLYIYKASFLFRKQLVNQSK